MKSRILFCFYLVFVLSFCPPILAQDKPAQEVSSDQAVSQDPAAEDFFNKDANEKRVDVINQTIERLAAVPVTESAARYGISEADVEARMTALSSLQNFYRRLNVAIEKTAGFADEEKKRREEKENAMLSLEAKPPFNLSYYDSFLQGMEDLDSTLANLRESMAREQKAIISAQTQLEEAGKAVRLAKSEAESAKGTDQEQNKEWMLRRFEIKEELWKVTLAYLKRNLENINLQVSVASLRLEQEEDLRRYIHDNLAYDQKDLDEGLAR